MKDKGIKIMDWSACSPDLNPIENLWSQLKRAINNRNHIPTGREDLIIAIEEEWAKISAEHFNMMISHMPKRIEACRKAKGGHTKW
jgi:hypothetical protein